jgi:hypothetical protein
VRRGGICYTNILTKLLDEKCFKFQNISGTFSSYHILLNIVLLYFAERLIHETVDVLCACFHSLDGYSTLHHLIPEETPITIQALSTLVCTRHKTNPDSSTFTWILKSGLGRVLKMQLGSAVTEPCDPALIPYIEALIPILLSPSTSTSEPFIYSWWFEYTQHLLQSVSRGWRDVGLVVLKELVAAVTMSSPLPASYLVQGAGTEQVNGVYWATSRAPLSPGEVYKYEKAPNCRDGETETFSLMRCVLRSKAKWWFISIVDKEKPGTDKDIDYYCHKSTTALAVARPSKTGWILPVYPTLGRGIVSQEPAPTIVALWEDEDEETDQASPLKMFVTWCRDAKVLRTLLDTLVVSRDVHECMSIYEDIFSLMTDFDLLQAEDVTDLWWTEVEMSHYSDTAHHTLPSMVKLLPIMNPHVVDTLFDILDLEAAKPSLYVGIDDCSPVVKLLQLLVQNPTTQSAVYNRVVQVVWALHKQILFSMPTDRVSSLTPCHTMCKIYSKLSADAARRVLSHERDVLFDTTSHNPNRDSDVFHSVVCVLTLLTDYHIPLSVLDTSDIGEVLLADVESSVRRIANDPSNPLHARVATSGVTDEISTRLRAILKFYEQASRSMSEDMVDRLWNVFGPTSYHEQLFEFFRNAGVQDEHTNSVYPWSVCSYIFRGVLCSPSMDWLSCGTAACECFCEYYTRLRVKEGFDTDVALTIMQKIITVHQFESGRIRALQALMQEDSHFCMYCKKYLFEPIQQCGSARGEALHLSRCLWVLKHGVSVEVAWKGGSELLQVVWNFMLSQVHRRCNMSVSTLHCNERNTVIGASVAYLSHALLTTTKDTSKLFLQDHVVPSVAQSRESEVITLVARLLTCLLTTCSSCQSEEVADMAGTLIIGFVVSCVDMRVAFDGKLNSGDQASESALADTIETSVLTTALNDVIAFATGVPDCLCSEVAFEHILCLLSADIYPEVHNMVWTYLKCVEITPPLIAILERKGLLMDMLLLKEGQFRKAVDNSSHMNLCCICLENSKTVCVMPCRHACMCEECFNSGENIKAMTRCPVCRVTVSQIIKLLL